MGPFYFLHVVQKQGKLFGKNSRLCMLTDTVLAGVSTSSGEMSFCVRIEDVAELITDWRHLAIGVRVRDTPFGTTLFSTKKDHNNFTDMPVDVLLFTPTPMMLNEFVETFTALYSNRTNAAISVRERLPQESFAATLILQPEGRRVRIPASVVTQTKLPPLPLWTNWSGSEVESPLLRSRGLSHSYESESAAANAGEGLSHSGDEQSRSGGATIERAATEPFCWPTQRALFDHDAGDNYEYAGADSASGTGTAPHSPWTVRPLAQSGRY